MAQYDVSDVIGKTLYPTRPLDVYDHPGGNVIGTVSPPNPAGVVYSWVQGSDGSIWWMFNSYNSNLTNTTGNYYIEHDPGSFDVQALRQQGVITVKEKIEQAKKDNEDLVSRIGDIVKWIALTIAGGLVVKAVVERKSTAK